MELRNTRPDELDEVNAFRAGFRYGKDKGRCSPMEAEREMARYGWGTSQQTVACFCNGADDGASGEMFRYLLSYVVL